MLAKLSPCGLSTLPLIAIAIEQMRLKEVSFPALACRSSASVAAYVGGDVVGSMPGCRGRRSTPTIFEQPEADHLTNKVFDVSLLEPQYGPLL